MKNDSPQNECVKIHEFSNESAWVEFVGATVAKQIEFALETKNELHIALCGGSTPSPIYQALAARSELPWNKLHWWMGDERCVESSSTQRNELMIQKSFGSAWNFISPRFEGWGDTANPTLAAQNMHNKLLLNFGLKSGPDLCILGIGDDGHTASLFPGSPLLEEQNLLAAATPAPQNGTRRLTFTFPLLNKSTLVIFVARGMAKQNVVTQLAHRNEDLVASRIRAPHQLICWCNQG